MATDKECQNEVGRAYFLWLYDEIVWIKTISVVVNELFRIKMLEYENKILVLHGKLELDNSSMLLCLSNLGWSKRKSR